MATVPLSVTIPWRTLYLLGFWGAGGPLRMGVWRRRCPLRMAVRQGFTVNFRKQPTIQPTKKTLLKEDGAGLSQCAQGLSN
jgi:hypothetical protein